MKTLRVPRPRRLSSPPVMPVRPSSIPPAPPVAPTPGSPAAQGYRMPAEWEPHAATWLSWPRPEGISFPGGGYERAVPALVRMVGALAESEPVCINVCDDAHEAEVRRRLAALPGGHAHVRFHRIPTNEPWCRDHGPIFVTRDAEPRVAVCDFDYNAWGWKYPPFDADDVVPTLVAAALGGLPVFYPKMVLEGGSIDVNGSGTLLTTESCLLNPNRNPTFKKAQIEAVIRDHLGVSNILWLGDGIEGDDTDGHVDDLTRFVNRTTVVTVIEEDEHDSNHEPLQANLHTAARDDGGGRLAAARADAADAFADRARGPAAAGELRELLHRQHGGAAAGLRRSTRRLGGVRAAAGIAGTQDCAHRLPGTHLGVGRVPLPDPAAARVNKFPVLFSGDVFQTCRRETNVFETSGWR